jgi:hypothetical protein
MTKKNIAKGFTEHQLQFMLVDSVRRTNSFDYFWRKINRFNLTPIILAKIKEYIVDHNAQIFRYGRIGATLDDTPLGTYETNSFYTGNIEGSSLDGYRAKAINKRPLFEEIPDCLALIAGRGQSPSSVVLLDYDYVIHKVGVIQPLFKVIAVYGTTRRTQAEQLFIVGRDRYTGDAFALGIPNGFVDKSIDICLRWTMDMHKGDVADEI